VNGRLLSFTEIAIPPAGFEPDRVVGLVALPDGTRAMALLASGAPEIDAPVAIEEGPDGLLRFHVLGSTPPPQRS